MRLAGILILLSFTGRLSAQQLNGTALDLITKLPVTNAALVSKRGVGFTSSTGSFSLNYAPVGDTITITHIGYKTYKFGVGSGLIPTTIYLQSVNILLNEVSIRGIRNYKKDSADNRREFARIFNYKAPGAKSIFVNRSPYVNTGRPNNTSELVGIDVFQLASLFKKNKTTTLQKALIRDEQDGFIFSMFSKEKIQALTPLKGDSLQEFMVRYSPSVSQARTMTTYDMMIYIKRSYADFSKPQTKNN
ncbi:hypothetical protein [Mucilaginibacter sp.]|uniref:hypothetical protein n=1 Tax=Mucilaginibacter sp. TaxID=1882438 RepID=UPI002632518E|nr:hypothetical protein [Mucilaginibacter sp.]MDB5030667.1 hypothetical protein [Mucilaginibacter sp.]